MFFIYLLGELNGTVLRTNSTSNKLQQHLLRKKFVLIFLSYLRLN